MVRAPPRLPQPPRVNVRESVRGSMLDYFSIPVQFSQLNRLELKVDNLTSKLDQLLAGEKLMTQEMQDLITEVSNTVGVVPSVLTAIEGLEKRLSDAIDGGATKAQLKKMKDDLAAAKVSLAQAVANVPSDASTTPAPATTTTAAPPTT